MNIWSLDSDGSGEESEAGDLHSPPSLKTKSSASHVIISLMSWPSSKTKDEHNTNLPIIIVLFCDLGTLACMVILSNRQLGKLLIVGGGV